MATGATKLPALIILLGVYGPVFFSYFPLFRVGSVLIDASTSLELAGPKNFIGRG